MLKCGECTFFCEPDISEGGALGRCSHPEKPKTQITVLLSDPEMIRICDYEAECQHGYPDIWAARGAARLIRMQEKPQKVDHISDSIRPELRKSGATDVKIYKRLSEIGY